MKKLALLFLAVFLFTSCSLSEEAVKTNLGTEIAKDDFANEGSVHLRDKNLIYSLYDDTEVVTMYLTVSSGNAAEGTLHSWEEVNTYSAYDYDEMGVDRYKVAGLLQVGDENGLVAGEFGYGQVAPNCTVQIRGQTSSKNAQKNYKIKIKDNKGDWRGQTTIALNKHQGDGLRFRNKLGFELMKGIDEIMSLRTTFVHLYVKDTTEGGSGKFEDYGLYTQVEQLNKTALEAHGLDKRGHLYKINFCEFYRYEDIILPSDHPDYDLAAFEEILEVKGDDDHTKLITLLDRINDYSVPIETILEESFDIENVTYWMAFQLLMGNVDTQSRNFYLYSALNDDRWYILPWDLDGMMKRTEYEILKRSDLTEWEAGVSNYWGNVFFQRCLKSKTYREELDRAIEELYPYLLEKAPPLSDSLSDIVKPFVYKGRDLLHAPLTKTHYDRVVNGIENEIKLNYSLYKESLEKPLPFFIGVPEKTDSGYSLIWDPSYDFDAETVTYTVELARDYTFKNPIMKEEGLLFPEISLPKLEEGQYFVRITSKNKSGKTQTAFDYYITEGGKTYGTKCFWIDEKGNVTEEIYEE